MGKEGLGLERAQLVTTKHFLYHRPPSVMFMFIIVFERFVCTAQASFKLMILLPLTPSVVGLVCTATLGYSFTHTDPPPRVHPCDRGQL